MQALDQLHLCFSVLVSIRCVPVPLAELLETLLLQYSNATWGKRPVAKSRSITIPGATHDIFSVVLRTWMCWSSTRYAVVPMWFGSSKDLFTHRLVSSIDTLDFLTP